jgi:Ca-activated chloride channel family protein
MNALPMLTEDEVRARSGADTREEESGFGALRTERGCLPLRALDVRARIDGLLAEVELHQTFRNVHDVPLEATYIFPLPDRAAVTRFRLVVAGRTIDAELKERGQAREEYDRAIREGHRAAITEEERPGVFTLRVGNLPPGESAEVILSLAGPLPCSANEATFRFPLVVAPRYIPGKPLDGPQVGEGVAADTDAVPDASRISPPVLLPGFPNPVSLSLSVEVLPSELHPHGFRSSLHTVAEEQQAGAHLFKLLPGERLDRDFLLRFRVGGGQVSSSLSLVPDAEGEEGTFLLTLVPPAEDMESVRPRDVAFVLDRSGSMSGWKMIAARRALARMVDTLGERDRFLVLAFDNEVETPPGLPADQLCPATDRHRFRAAEYLAGVEARGGTEMARPLEQAVGRLTEDTDPGRERILVLITDGQVGNEDQLLRLLGPRVHNVRVFALGIDRAVNAGFLRRLADVGGGACELVESEDRLDEVMARTHRFIASPVLTGLRLEGTGLGLVEDSVVPGRLPDLFAGSPLFVYGRFRGTPEVALHVEGQDAGERAWSATLPGSVKPFPAAGSVWARGRVRELEDAYVLATVGGRRDRLEKEIVGTSLRFGVLCRFTAYVAVDRAEKVNPGGQVHGIVQPVELPSGWEAQTLGGAAPLFAASFGAPEAESLESCLRYMPPASMPAAAPPPAARAETDYDSPPRAMYRKKSRARKSAGIEEPGWLSRLLAKLGWGKGPSEEEGEARSLYERVRALADALDQVGPLGDRERMEGFEQLLQSLEALQRELADANDHPAVETLRQDLERLRQLLPNAAAQRAAINTLFRHIRTTLHGWLADNDPAKSRRKSFWK